MRDGFYKTGYNFSEKILYISDMEGAAKQVAQFSIVRTRKIKQLLISLLCQNNAVEVRKMAIQILATLHVNEAIPELRELLKENNFYIQAEAIKALAILHDKNIIFYLVNFLRQLDKETKHLQFIGNQVVSTLQAAEVLPNIRKLIKDKNPNIRTAALNMLITLRADELTSEVIVLLEDKDPYVREAAINFLESLNNEEAIPEIRKLIQDREPYTQVAAIEALGTLHDKDMLPVIRKLIQDRNANVSAAAISYLALFRDKEELSVMEEFIWNRDWSIKRAAVRAFAVLHIKEVIPDIRKLFSNNDSWELGYVIEALTRLHDNGSIPKFRKRIYEIGATSEIVESLAVFRDQGSIPAIRVCLDFDYSWIQSSAIKALATLHDTESIPKIRKLILNEVASVQSATIEAFGALHEKETISEIRRFFDNGTPYVQMAAVKVLGTLRDDKAIPVIRRLINQGDSGVQEAAIRALGELQDIHSIPVINKRLDDRYLEVQCATSQALARLNHSSPELFVWQRKQLDILTEKTSSIYSDERKEAAQKLSSIFTEQSVALLDKLIDDAEWSVVIPALESLGIIGEYAPELVQQQVPKLLALTNHTNLELQDTAVSALGRFISFRGEAKTTDLSEMDQKIRSTLQAFIHDQNPKNSFRRRVAVEALGATGRPECARDFGQVLNKLEESDSLYFRCLYWKKRLETDNSSGSALQKKLTEELKQLTAEKADWRKKRDSNDELRSSEETIAEGKERVNERWHKEQIEHLLGHTLARISPPKKGVNLLNHPLYQVRQGAIRALAAKADAPLIGTIIQAHQAFDPADLPSPFPYAAFRAIDLALWNLEYTGTKDDVAKLKDVLANLKPCQVPGQEGAIKERLEWTIERLGENLAKNAELAAANQGKQKGGEEKQL
ncbi:MAG: HEAT repeat domain-containing protein [Candidatus Electrothrix aestuarii]|uniref:HEAT repeat domain-containing protein n=1 Tax=Candidatus Electrothrix aestuarii TaxID=3062594 RepID=A0AAU8LU17_9BACT|nr:HEAT repeat domain-containing protein [Candidatus Electrothrix aestuarii]